MRPNPTPGRGPFAVLATLGLAALPLALLTAPGAVAQPGPADCVPEVAADTPEGAERLLSVLHEARTEGRDAAETDRRLAAAGCLTRVGGPAPDTALPPAAGLALAPPQVYAIGEVAGRDRWVAFTEWRWNEIPAHPMTGNQAVATWFDTKVSPVLQVVHHAGATDAFPNTSREDAADVNGHGVGFLIRPERNATDTNIATGSLALVFEAGTTTCTDLTAHSAFAHTWGNTGINDLTVGPGGVSYDWTDQIDRALNVSGPTTVAGVCP
ncbi:hypothetical protein RM844_18665 [Streptomyces sp. DSM 44915]|uniref:Secreted protein n=1 Tax=Streptomyces chisholmiae TaxID=3075540 RepID=A0ABU2JUU8_9ACTN|nr:hypothetical protein [Streptomyces sp. DSM 44915]MDT0268309.1 hypothetical protein [Streptomyces sp. DSM 44915]